MKPIVIVGLLLCSAFSSTVAHGEAPSIEKTTTSDDAKSRVIEVLDVMTITKEEFIAKGLGNAASYQAQRAAIADGSSYILSAVSVTGSASVITNGKLPTTSSATSGSVASSSSGWRRVGQYVGGGSEVEEDEFFSETDRVFEKWVEAEQARKVREALERKKKEELEKKRLEQKNNKNSKNAEERDGSNENGAQQKKSKNSDVEDQEDDGKAVNNKKHKTTSKKQLQLALPASQISASDAKRRKIVLSTNTTIEQKIKTLAVDVRGVMRRVRSAFLPAASDQFGIEVTGKTAANNDRHRQLLLREFFDGQIPTPNTTASEKDAYTLAEKKMGAIMYELLKYSTSTTTAATASEVGTDETKQTTADGEEATLSSPSTASTSPTALITNFFAASYPRLYSVPFVDPSELTLLVDELRNLKIAERAIEREFAAIEKGSYAKDLKLKIESLKKKSEESSSSDQKKESNIASSAAATIEIIESNPRDYYRALRQHTMTPKVTEELATLTNLINTNYRYQSQLVHSSYPIIVSSVLPRLRKTAEQLRSAMRANDESTSDLRRQLKEMNQYLKLVNNDISALSSLSTRMQRFRNNVNNVNNENEDIVSSLKQRNNNQKAQLTHLLPAADVTTLIQWITAERRTAGGAESKNVHPEDYARVTKGEQPLLDGNGGAAADSDEGSLANDGEDSFDNSDNSAAARRSRRQRRRNGGKRDDQGNNYLRGGGNDGAVELTRRPLFEWIDIVSFTLFGLSGSEMMTLVVSAFGLVLIETIIEFPSLLVTHTLFLSNLQTKLYKWAHGNRLRGPSTAGKVFLAISRLYLFVVSLMTNLHLKFGRISLPLLGLYYCDWMEAYVLGGMQWSRQVLSALVALLRGGSSSSSAPYQSLAEIQQSLRQRVPFTVWVLSTPAQQACVGLGLALLGLAIMVILVNPVYKRASQRLTRHFSSANAKKTK